ncbi:MAG: Hsp20/alpha crystallin family protein [Gemmatimonadaceae bacterium]|nr:Hsp20/alpha crystallin family protein [Gemmatimonadaceae bacterium]
MVRTTKFTAPVFGLRREIDQLFEDTFGNMGVPRVGSNAWLPVVDVKETADAILFDLEMPGVTEEKLEITCDAGVLAISGEKANVKKEGEEGKWHIVERTFGAFRRSFQLPANVQEDKIAATLTNGVLHVVVPKAELAKPKRIEVKAQ